MTQQSHSWAYTARKPELKETRAPQGPVLNQHLKETGMAVPGEGNGNPLQYSCLENPMDRGAWRATVHEITESDTTEWLTLPLLLVRLVFLSLLFSWENRVNELRDLPQAESEWGFSYIWFQRSPLSAPSLALSSFGLQKHIITR